MKTIQHGLEGKVTAVHSISLACHNKQYRQKVYQMSKDAGLSFISCPSAWIDSPRQDVNTNSQLSDACRELLEHDLCVAIGSDNIHDVYKPYADGDMMFELRLLLESFKLYDDDLLIKIAVDNGKQVMVLNMKVFYLNRVEDESGISGTGQSLKVLFLIMVKLP